jgi:hypothetical protein
LGCRSTRCSFNDVEQHAGIACGFHGLLSLALVSACHGTGRPRSSARAPTFFQLVAFECTSPLHLRRRRRWCKLTRHRGYSPTKNMKR